MLSLSTINTCGMRFSVIVLSCVPANAGLLATYQENFTNFLPYRPGLRLCLCAHVLLTSLRRNLVGPLKLLHTRPACAIVLEASQLHVPICLSLLCYSSLIGRKVGQRLSFRA